MDLVDQVLAEFGLSENEASVYRAALKHDETGPFELARETKIPRTTVYEILTGLALKGLIELQKSDGLMKQQTKVKAKNPSILREKINDKREQLTRLEVDVVNILPELKGEYLRHVPNADFRFYPGIEGAKEVYRRMYLGDLEADVVTWDCLMPMDAFGKEWMNNIVDEINKSRKKGLMKRRSILPLNKWTKHVISYQFERDNRYLKEQFRFVENPSFQLNQDIHVQGEMTYIVNGTKDEAWGVAIKSKMLADSQRSIFELIWPLAKPLTIDMVLEWGPNKFLAEEKRRQKTLSKSR